MAKSTKSYEERMLEMEKKEQESLEKAKRYAAQKKELLKRKKAEESKKRTHRLCQVGGAVESVLGAPIEEEDIPKLIGFLKKQEANGKFFSKAMGADSLDVFQIIMGIEEEFDIEIPNDAAENISTVADAVDAIKNALN